MASQDSTVYDELLECLNDRMFQIPVKSFMDEHCLIFDASIEVSEDHFAVFASYQQLVKDLLKDFCQSKRVSFSQIQEGVLKLYADPDLREVFGASIEPMLLVDDFDLFSHAMISHNFLIQEQVLQMILMSTGIIPESFLNTRTIQSDDEKQRQTTDATRKPQSQSKFTSDEGHTKVTREKENDLKSKKEKEIEEHRKLIEQEMRQLALESAPALKSTKSSPQVQASDRSTGKSSSTDAKKSSSQMSSAETAQRWLKEAHEESLSRQVEGDGKADSRRKQMDPSDMAQRQQFLREQRDKILAMRREAREKQLGTDTDPRTKASSKDATVRQKPETKLPASESADHEKMLAKRRALAAKLRQEVVDKQ